jgi:hypothetical protein
MILGHHLVTLKGSVESVSELSGENRVDTTIMLERGIFDVGGVEVGAYVKATGEVDPSKPSEAAIKVKTGLTVRFSLRGLIIEVSPLMEVFNLKPGSGEAKGGVNFMGGELTIGSF